MQYLSKSDHTIAMLLMGVEFATHKFLANEERRYEEPRGHIICGPCGAPGVEKRAKNCQDLSQTFRVHCLYFCICVKKIYKMRLNLRVR